MPLFHAKAVFPKFFLRYAAAGDLGELRVRHTRHTEGQAFDQGDHALGVVGRAREVLAWVVGQLPARAGELGEQGGDGRVEEAVEGAVLKRAPHEGVYDLQDLGPVGVGQEIERHDVAGRHMAGEVEAHDAR